MGMIVHSTAMPTIPNPGAGRSNRPGGITLLLFPPRIPWSFFNLFYPPPFIFPLYYLDFYLKTATRLLHGIFGHFKSVTAVGLACPPQKSIYCDEKARKIKNSANLGSSRGGEARG
jgi:hypothetical protein